MTALVTALSPDLLPMTVLVLGWLLDLLLGDPPRMPHVVVLFGRAISRLEHLLNRGARRRARGALMALTLVLLVVSTTAALLWGLRQLHPLLATAASVLLVFQSLAGTTLVREVRAVFSALDRSLADGRRQVARIVGRDTDQLSAHEVRTAALETLAENLSDGVVAPLFWYVLFGLPGMLAYKLVNTMDSMVGYRTPRYRQFGCWAARMDDAANYVPARLTALLLLLAAGRPRQLPAVWREGRHHASPNSGYPEAALALLLGCRFGGPHHYFGQLFPKPYIGTRERPLTASDLQRSVRLCRTAEVLGVAASLLALWALGC